MEEKSVKLLVEIAETLHGCLGKVGTNNDITDHWVHLRGFDVCRAKSCSILVLNFCPKKIHK